MGKKTITTLNLLNDFSPTDYETWRAVAEKLLNGNDFNKTLKIQTYEAIELNPIYSKEDLSGLNFTDALPGFPVYARGYQAAGYHKKPWAVSQSIPYFSPEEFNNALLQDLHAGQTAAILELNKISIYGVQPENLELEKFSERGIVISTFEDITRTLNGIDLSKIPIFIKPGLAALPI